MRYVNDILFGTTLDEFTAKANKEQIIELRTSASVAIVEEKRIRDTGLDTKDRRKYIGFLSAVIQECDKKLSLFKLNKKQANKDFSLLLSEYGLFRKLTREAVGNSVYSQILNKMKANLK
jgi:hypothetical protein